ncbi:MFS transporter [Clostridium sp. HBUAS56010]|uniref:MFS transporter n=1 Tax=Clostridium sp. HBUAS56010 TaxID=2571127 RepID=UPI001FA9CEEE|nr:MFS transporter [Clostridium sp. HBUAS56010]
MVSLFWFAQYIYIPFQTTYLTFLGVSSTFIGIVVGGYGITQLIFRFPLGICADSLGRHKCFIMAGALFSGLASLFRIFWDCGLGFLVANLFSGLASAMWISFMVFYTNHFSAKSQQCATSKIVMFNNFGMLLGFLFSTVSYRIIGMKGICILSVMAGIAAFFVSFQIKESCSRNNTVNLKVLFSVCKRKRLWLFSILALIQQGIQLTTAMSFTNQILKDLGASNELIGISSIIYMISAVCFAAFASTFLCCRKGPRFWIPFVFGIVAVYCILVPSADTVQELLLLQILPGMSTGILFSYLTSEAMCGIPSDRRSTAMGLFQAVYAIGMTTFPVFTGFLASSFSMRTGYLTLAGIALSGMVISSLYYVKKHRSNMKI